MADYFDNSKSVSEWLHYAKNNYKSAEHLFNNMHPAPLEVICNLCQQCGEKVLKAALISNGQEFKKTHDLSILLKDLQNCLGSDTILKLQDNCARLSAYATQARYPNSGIEIEKADAILALKDAKDIFETTLQLAIGKDIEL